MRGAERIRAVLIGTPARNPNAVVVLRAREPARTLAMGAQSATVQLGHVASTNVMTTNTTQITTRRDPELLLAWQARRRRPSGKWRRGGGLRGGARACTRHRGQPPLW